MAQHDYVIDNADGATVRADINSALAAGVSLNSGSSAPSTTYAYMWWADTGNDLLKRRDSTNTSWIVIAPLDDNLIDGQSEDTDPDPATDFLLSYDYSASAFKKILIGTVRGAHPAFSAYLSADQTASAGVATKLVCDTEEYDTHSDYASGRFTATIAGYYQFNTTVRPNSSGSVTGLSIEFYKGGSNFNRAVSVPLVAGNHISASMLIYLAASEYVEIYGTISGTGTTYFNYFSSAITCRFSGALVAPA